MMLDMERIVSDHLREHPDVVALDTRIVGKTPTQDTRGTRTSWVRATLLAAPNVTGGHPEHLIAYVLQFDCYAGADSDAALGAHGQPEASTLAIAVREVLVAMPTAAVAGAVVTSVRISTHLRNPDTEFKPARERVIVTAEIRAHA